MLQVRNVAIAIGIILFGLLLSSLVLYFIVNGYFSGGNGIRATVGFMIGGIFIIGGIWRLIVLIRFR